MQSTLNQIIGTIGAYIPNLIGALAVLIIGWLIALIAATIVRGVVRRTKLDNKIASWRGEGEGDQAPGISKGIEKGVFWLIMFLVLTIRPQGLFAQIQQKKV